MNQASVVVTVEVGPDQGGWKAERITIIDDGNGEASKTNELIRRSRTRIVSELVGEGVARIYKCELKVKDRKGRYTNRSRSYMDQDPKGSPAEEH